MKKSFLNIFSILAFSALILCSGCAASKEYTVDKNINESNISGTVVLEMKEIALAIGKVTGEGTLTYNGEDHPFKLKGIDVGSISNVTINTTGNVFHLDQLSDFEGIYFQGKVALSFGDSGRSGMFLVNRHGVTIHLASEKEKGFDLTLGRGGIKIKFID